MSCLRDCCDGPVVWRGLCEDCARFVVGVMVEGREVLPVMVGAA